MPNPQNLRKPTSEEAKEMQKKSVEKRKENKTMREIYEEVIANKKNEIVKALNKGIEEGNLATLKELREGTDGNKINLSGTVKTEMETTEDRIKLFDEIVNS
jgi:hydrogenase maturation factor HypF (carbamoyltransferase family)